MAKIKYYYQEEPLKEWAKKNNCSYSTIMNFINREKENFQTIEELVKMAVKHALEISNYMYEGIPLKAWCKKNDYSYNTAISIIYSLKDKILDKDILVKEAVKCLETKQKKTKYYYQGISLIKYCQENGLEYQTIIGRIARLIKENPELSQEKALKIAIEEYNDNRCQYYYQGKSLKKYCEEQGYSYPAIARKLIGKTNEEIDELIKNYFLSPKKVTFRYNINGLTLKEYCESNNYHYTTVKSYLRKIIQTNPSINKNIAAKKALLKYEKEYIHKEEFFYQGKPLIDYCHKKHYNYQNIYSLVINLPVKNPLQITEDELKKVVEKYQNKIIKEQFKKLKVTTNQEELLTIATRLNIDLESIKIVLKNGLSLKSTINLIWYFGNNETKIKIRNQKVKSLLTINDFSTLKLNELIGLYKANIYDTRNFILEKYLKQFQDILNTDLKKYNLEKEDLEEELIILILEFIESNNFRSSDKINYYLNIYIIENIQKIISNKLKINNEISLNNQNSNLPQILNTNINYVNPEYLSTELLNIILTLSYLEQEIILSLYLKQIPKKELSKLTNISLENITKIEEKALIKIKQGISTSIQLKKKIYK